MIFALRQVPIWRRLLHPGDQFQGCNSAGQSCLIVTPVIHCGHHHMTQGANNKVETARSAPMSRALHMAPRPGVPGQEFIAYPAVH